MHASLVAGADCTQDVILSFTTPVDNLTFNAFGNSTPTSGTFAQVDVYQLGVLTHANVALLVSHVPDVTCGFFQGQLIDCNPDPQNLAYLGITQVIIHNNVDPAGTAYDDFSFTLQSDTASVPEPSTLLLTGLCGIFWAGRRFLARKPM
jgi:PEP-CTERM motif